VQRTFKTTKSGAEGSFAFQYYVGITWEPIEDPSHDQCQNRLPVALSNGATEYVKWFNIKTVLDEITAGETGAKYGL
jgi:hypothetical protein